MAGNLVVSVRSDLHDAVVRLQAKNTLAIEASAVRALNRAAVSTRAAASQEIRKVYNLKAAVIKRQIRISRASKARLFAELVATGRRIPLYDFAARQTRAGVTARVLRQRQLFRHTFIATMPTGHVGVFVRQGPKRLPIRELKGISIPKAMVQKKIMDVLKRTALERFKIEFERDLKFRGGL